MADIILIEGSNELNVQLVPIPEIEPGIELISLIWDAIPPFDAGSRHTWTVMMKNLAVSRLTYQLWMSMNDKRFMGYTANLAAGEVRETSQPFIFGVEGSYTLIIKALYQDVLFDEIRSSVAVVIPPEEVTNGWIVGGLVWTGELWLSITRTNEWPARELLVRVTVQNTGTVEANFEVRLGIKKGSAYLAPGERQIIEFNYTPSLISVEENYDLYGNGILLEHNKIRISAY